MSFYLGSELMECCIYSPQRLIPMSIQLGSEQYRKIYYPTSDSLTHISFQLGSEPCSINSAKNGSLTPMSFNLGSEPIS